MLYERFLSVTCWLIQSCSIFHLSVENLSLEDDSFSTNGKCSEKLSILTPRFADVRVRIRR